MQNIALKCTAFTSGCELTIFPIIYDVPENERFDEDENPLDYVGNESVRRRLYSETQTLMVWNIYVKCYGKECGRILCNSLSSMRMEHRSRFAATNTMTAVDLYAQKNTWLGISACSLQIDFPDTTLSKVCNPYLMLGAYTLLLVRCISERLQEKRYQTLQAG